MHPIKETKNVHTLYSMRETRLNSTGQKHPLKHAAPSPAHKLTSLTFTRTPTRF